MENKNWTEYKFSEFVNINPFVSLKANEEYSFVEMKDLEDGNKYCFPKIKKIKGGGSKFQNGDTLFARITPCLENGKICQVKGLENNLGFGSTEFYVFRGKEDISDTEFVYYLSRWNDVRDHAEINLDGTSGRQRVPKASFDDLIIQMPELPEQKAIASVLSSLDDKIDLLHQQNQTLEALAETLFRQWFVEEAKEDWEEGKLGDAIEIFDSQRIPLSNMERDKKKDGTLYPYYGAAKIMDYINDYIFDGEYILFAEDGTVQTTEGYPVLQYAIGKFWVNNHTHVIKAKAPYNNFFLLNYLRKKNIELYITGAVQPKINQANLKSIDFPKFPLDKVSEFIKLTNQYFDKINLNNTQIQTLTQLRDTLLPKLMSGEVRVKV